MKTPAAGTFHFHMLIAATCFAVSAPAAAEWAAYFQGHRSNHFFDPQTIRRGGDLRWVSELTNLNSSDTDGTRSIVTELEIDCAKGQFRVKTQARYRKSKAQGQPTSQAPGTGGSSTAPPNTPIDMLTGRICQ
jgi:hypothetical protein